MVLENSNWSSHAILKDVLLKKDNRNSTQSYFMQSLYEISNYCDTHSISLLSGEFDRDKKDTSIEWKIIDFELLGLIWDRNYISIEKKYKLIKSYFKRFTENVSEREKIVVKNIHQSEKPCLVRYGNLHSSLRSLLKDEYELQTVLSSYRFNHYHEVVRKLQRWLTIDDQLYLKWFITSRLCINNQVFESLFNEEKWSQNNDWDNRLNTVIRWALDLYDWDLIQLDPKNLNHLFNSVWIHSFDLWKRNEDTVKEIDEVIKKYSHKKYWSHIYYKWCEDNWFT